MIRKEIRLILKAILICIGMCIIITVGIALLLRTPLFSSFMAFLYRLLALDAICSAVMLISVILLWIKKNNVFGLSLSLAIMCVGISAVFLAFFLSLGPMTIERSYTIYSLSDMSDHSDTIYSAEDIKLQFIEGYIEDSNESLKRIEEQVSIGNLEEVDGGYRISEKGKRLVWIFRMIEMILPVPDESSIYPNGH